MGRYGGVWAHDETRKSFGIAGPRVVEPLKLSVPVGRAGRAASAGERCEVAENLRDVVGKLATEVGLNVQHQHKAAGRVRRDPPAALLLSHGDRTSVGGCRCPVVEQNRIARHAAKCDARHADRRDDGGLRPGNFINVVQNIWYPF